MRTTTGRTLLLCLPALACGALLVPLSSQALSTKPARPGATTGKVSHVRGSSAVLEGTVSPHGAATTYFFQFGPTVAYGTQTATAALPASFTTVKVGVTVIGLRLGEHYRIVATNSFGTTFGHDRTFAPGSGALKFVIAKERNEPPTPYGGTFVLRGTLTGTGNTTHRLVLQASPYPYLEPFATVSASVLPSATGSFVMKAPHMTASTQFRIASLDPRPLLSPVITARISVRVTLHVKVSSQKGFVRLYGTVTPAESRARVSFQLLKPIRPGRSERETAFGTQFTTTTKHGTHSFSRFSLITAVRRRGYYRAFVQVRKGPLVSGTSETVRLAATRKARKR